MLTKHMLPIEVQACSALSGLPAEQCKKEEGASQEYFAWFGLQSFAKSLPVPPPLLRMTRARAAATDDLDLQVPLVCQL